MSQAPFEHNGSDLAKSAIKNTTVTNAKPAIEIIFILLSFAA